MNYKLIIAGLIFLFNPEVNILDIMPDFIGIFLIMRGIFSATYVSPSMEDGYLSLKKYSMVSLVKTLAFIPLVSVASSDPAFYLLFTFGFSVVGLIFILPGIRNVFESIYSLSDRYGSAQKGTLRTGFIFTLFLIIKAILPVLPELVYLYLPEDGITEAAVYPLAFYKPAIVLLCLALFLISGIIWLIITINYFSSLRRNTEFNKALLNNISNVRHSRIKIITESVTRVVTYMILAVFATVSPYIDGMRVIPIILSPIFILLALNAAEKSASTDLKKAKKAAITAIVASSVAFVASAIYNTMYQDYASMVFHRVSKQFILPAAIECISLIFIGASIYYTYLVLRNIVDAHTGNFWERSFVTHNSFSAKERDGIKFRLKLGLVLGIILTVSNAVSHCLLYIVPLYQIINSAVNVAYGLYMTFIYLDIKSAVKEKYADIKDANV